MTPCIFSCTWLLPFVVLATLSTGELEFYQDAMPETSENLALKELARYIEAQGHQRAHRAHLSTLFSSRVANQHNLEPERQNERDILQAFAEKSGIADMVRESSFNAWIRQAQRPYYESTNQMPREYDFGGYYGMSSMPRTIGEYINMKMPLPGDNGATMKERPDDYRQISAMGSPYNGGGVDEGMREETISDFRNRHAKTKGDEEISGPGMNMMRLPASAPEFTFKFNDAKVNEVHPFAVKPNDPRFYQDAPSSIGSDESDRQKASRSASEEGEEDQINEESDVLQKNTDAENVIFHKLKDITTVPVPELDEQPGHHPLIVPVNHSLNNDIYFIAIVAGCSAAVMFALVLISLTWCRLQRGVKAAADIEYPAYGVTGPNKDVSPSGDQRLAQSAQMYHFQHQKQQIIAMENRTSATRDPGSVSEAESDEENEEGDYTVYECPGLASTGEMEVKNPLFHDDPTPATPAQTNTDEDHI